MGGLTKGGLEPKNYIESTRNFVGNLSGYTQNGTYLNLTFNTFYLDSTHDKLNGFETGEPDNDILLNSITYFIEKKTDSKLQLLSHEEVVNYDEKVVIFDAGLSHHPLMGLSNFLDSASTPSLTQFLKDNPQKPDETNTIITSNTIKKKFEENKGIIPLQTKSQNYISMITQSDWTLYDNLQHNIKHLLCTGEAKLEGISDLDNNKNLHEKYKLITDIKENIISPDIKLKNILLLNFLWQESVKYCQSCGIEENSTDSPDYKYAIEFLKNFVLQILFLLVIRFKQNLKFI